jgi:D-alanine-D-alanine ligase-like ATP-grasp enzyme
MLMTAEGKFKEYFRTHLGSRNCAACYHLLGVDVMLDEDLHPLIIEVNGLPSMQIGHVAHLWGDHLHSRSTI